MILILKFVWWFCKLTEILCTIGHWQHDTIINIKKFSLVQTKIPWPITRWLQSPCTHFGLPTYQLHHRALDKNSSPSDALYGMETIWTLKINRHFLSMKTTCTVPMSRDNSQFELIFTFSLKKVTHIVLTHCGLVTPYGVIVLGQHWFR